jgi:hypothetical protein
MPVQLDKIVCSFCKEFYRPKTRAQTKYCSKKCQYDGGNKTKRDRRDGLRKNIAILKSLKIPQGESIEMTREQLNALSFNGDIHSKTEIFWNEELKANSTKYYFDYYTISNQGGVYLITELK